MEQSEMAYIGYLQHYTEKNPINNAQIISHIKTDKMMECLAIDSMNLSEVRHIICIELCI